MKQLRQLAVLAAMACLGPAVACGGDDRQVEVGTGGAAGGGTGGAGATGGGGTGGAGGDGGTGGVGGSGGGSPCTPPVAGGLCDTAPQCGCAGNQACYSHPSDPKTRCATAGTTQPYHACKSNGDCTKGYGCFGYMCKLYCESNEDCAATSGSCTEATFYDGQPAPWLKYCPKKCDLLNPAGACGPGYTCSVWTFPWESDCASAGTATTAGACVTDSSACAPGYVCLTNGDCEKWCRVQVTGDCPAGKTCVGLEMIIDGTKFGACVS